MSSMLDRVDIGTGPVSPEQRLFMGVIAAAVMDATGGVRGGDSPITVEHTRERARAWFADAGTDFETVCTFAGFEPMMVRDRVLAYFDRVNVDPSQIIKMSGSGSSLLRQSSCARATTMSDVATHAGVSVITVARVLDGKRHVAEGTKAGVLASVQALGYVPSRRGAARVH